MRAIVLLSGGLDSAVALYWALNIYDQVDSLIIDYGQIARSEILAAWDVWRCSTPSTRKGDCRLINLSGEVLASKASITGNALVSSYDSVQEAVDNTATDTSYLPLRNAVFACLAANHLLVSSSKGGDVVMGIRGRAGPGGFPDCTSAFTMAMSFALEHASGVRVRVVDPLNIEAPTRARTIALARTFPGCFEALRYTVSCFHGTRCGKCLPCLRRAEAFASLGLKDPADAQ